MKNNEPLYLNSLQYMEMVAMSRETTTDVANTATTLMTTDEPLKRMIEEIADTTNRFEMATRNPQDSSLTKEKNLLDSRRDVAFRRFGRKLAFYELSEDPYELRNYEIVWGLWEKHKDIPGLNQKKQSGATDNFLNDTSKSPFTEAIEHLQLDSEVVEIKTTNEAFKAFEKDSREQAAKDEMEKAKDLRRDLSQQYSFFYNYIWTMANAYPDHAEWDTLLNHMNVIRKRYNELITRRRAAAKNKDGADTSSSN